MRTRSDFLIDSLHVFLLTSFAVAQPLFDALSRGPEFFLARQSNTLDVLIAVLVLCLVLPSVLVLLEALAGRLGAGARKALHAVLVAALLALIALPVLHRLPVEAPGILLILAAIILGVAVTVTYLRFGTVRTFLTALSPSVLIFPGLFLFNSPISAILFPPAVETIGGTASSTAPVVMIVFDEFPTTALVNEDSRIDPVRYPNIATLLQDATWFRNATTVSELTQGGIAAIVTGRYPGRTPFRDTGNRTRNLFVLLGGSYDMKVSESYVPFCPRELCGTATRDDLPTRTPPLISDLFLLLLHLVLPPDMRSGLPDLSYPSILLRDQTPEALMARRKQILSAAKSESTRLSERSERFARFIDMIDSTRRPTFYYLHVLLPHEPYAYLPSERICASEHRGTPMRWRGGELVTARYYQRFLFQVGYVDTLLGKLLDRLKAKGLYDASLLVVTADHGVSHRQGDHRRGTTKTNICDIVPVPLIIKAPHQRTGSISDRNVENVDILPTMASILGIDVPWPMDGQSAFDLSVPERTQKLLLGPPFPWESLLTGKQSKERIVFEPSLAKDCLEREKNRAARVGSDGRLRVGPHGALIGRRVSDVGLAGEANATARLAYAGLYEHFDPQSGFVPCMVEGQVATDQGSAAGMHVAVAINGTLQAVTQTVGLPRARVAGFSTVVPETAFRAGGNRVDVFIVTERGGRARLAPTKGRPGTTYTLHDLEGERGLSITSPDGTTIRVRPEAMEGQLERVVREAPPGLSEAEDGGTALLLEFRGWAADLEKGRLPAAILVFVDGRFYHSAAIGDPRPDLHKRYGEPLLGRAGFTFTLPVWLGEDREKRQVRVFAVSRDGVASELPES